MNEPPKYDSSQEMTAVRPSVPSAAVDRTLECMQDDGAVDVERARREAQERITLQPCPWCSNGMVHPDQRAAWLDAYPELEPSPESQPEEPEAA